MSEKTAHVLYGAKKDDMPACPDEDGWHEWAFRHPKVLNHATYPPVFRDLGLDTTYEASPEYIGFHAAQLEYSETFEPFNDHAEKLHKAKAAWSVFSEFVYHETGCQLPEGRVVVLMDE